jgi:predicted permease
MRAADLYRRLLVCYPASFRDEYGHEMVDAFEDQLREAAGRGGPLAAAAIWIDTVCDLLFTAPKEHVHVIRQDLRHAIRLLAATPGFTVAAVLLLALGIGANAAIFSLVNNVLMNTLPVRSPEELVILTDPDASGVAIGSSDGQRSLLTYAEFRALQDRTRSFVSLMASQSNTSHVQARIGGGEQPERLSIRLVSASYFSTLGVPAAIGRTFDAGDEQAEGAAPYAVISHDYWQRRLSGRADILGQTITLPDGVFSVIGVMPPTFFGETVGARPDAWLPLTMQPIVLPGRDMLRERPGDVEKVMWLHAFGRLRPGVTLERARTDANLVFQQSIAAFYGSGTWAEETRRRLLEQHLTLSPAATGASQLRRTFSEPLLVLLGAAGVVLLIACANLGNLLLARTMVRSREMAVRLALGASRGRLMRQLVTESLCLSMLGGFGGLGVALLMRAGLLHLLSDLSDAVTLPPAIDTRVLAFIFLLTLVAGLIIGVLPALRITRTAPSKSLREQGRGLIGSVAWLRVGKFLVVGQLALSLPLIVGADLLLRTFSNLQRADLGYRKAQLWNVRIDATAARYERPRQAMAYEQLLARIREIPGIGRVTLSTNGLFSGSDYRDRIVVEGFTPTEERDRSSRYDQVGPDYFSTVGIPIRAGREITADDRVNGRMVCVINETFAKRFFDGRNPLGLRVTQVYADQRHTYEVVGIAADNRQNQLRGAIEHRFYVPVTQPSEDISTISFLVRPAADAGGVMPAVRRVIEQAEPNMRILLVESVGEAIDRRIVQDRLLGRLSVAFGVVALLLAAIGLYGILSYGVARRTNEIGIRKALGAQHGTLIVMVMRETGWLLAIGLIAGSALAAVSIRLIASRLFGIAPTDPVVFATAIAILGIVAALATWLPAYRASRVDPLIALRSE